MRDQGEVLYFDSRPPHRWDTLGFRLNVHGRLLSVEGDGGPLDVNVHGRRVRVGADSVAVTLADAQAPPAARLPGGRAGTLPPAA
jgi:alpha,alpha-trehalose phosphorylase